MTKVELAERRWRERGDELGALQLLNVLNVPVTLYAFYAAYHQRPDGATVATSLSTTLKFIFVAAVVRRYEDDLETVDWNDFETDD